MNLSLGSRSLSTDFPIPGDNILDINPVIFLNTQHTVKPCMYILLCSDGSYYTGSTKNLYRRLAQHQAGEGANHTKKRLPVKLVYLEIYSRIDHAFYREKQVQKWRREKKEALIHGHHARLPELAIAYRDLRTGFNDVMQ